MNGSSLGVWVAGSVDELRRIRGLLEVYEAAIGEIRELRDPGLDEFEARLEARAAAAAHDYFESCARSARSSLSRRGRHVQAVPTRRT